MMNRTEQVKIAQAVMKALNEDNCVGRRCGAYWEWVSDEELMRVILKGIRKVAV
jgi:hypothetical protein